LILPTDRRESSTRSGSWTPRLPLGCHCGSITYASRYRFANRSERPGNSRGDDRCGRRSGVSRLRSCATASPSGSEREEPVGRHAWKSSQASACGVSPDPPACRAEAEVPVAGSISAVSRMRSLEVRSLSSGMRRRREKFGVWPAGCLAC
jgi:hypothetical protein